MWTEVHYCMTMQCWALYVGTKDGYIIRKVYGYKVTARISAKLNGYKFCTK